MLSSSTEDEKLLVSYIGAFTAAFRSAPASLCKSMGGPAGIFLMIDANPVDTGASEGRSRRSSPTRDSPKMRSHSHSYDGGDSKVSSPRNGMSGEFNLLDLSCLHCVVGLL